MPVPVLFITQADVDMLNARFKPEVELTPEAVAELVTYFQPKADAKAELLRVSQSELSNATRYRELLAASGFAEDNPLMQSQETYLGNVGDLVASLTPSEQAASQ